MRLRAALLLGAVLVTGCGSGSATTYAPQGINLEASRDLADPGVHLDMLQAIASRSGGTRAAGTLGDRRTVDYIARSLRASGWKVTLQPVRFPYFERRAEPRLGPLRPGAQVRVAEYSGAGRFRARVTRLDGLGCSVRDFEDLPDGDVALVDRGTCFFSVKARNAQRAGARGIVVSDVQGTTPVSATLLRPGVRIPVLITTAAAARRIEGRTVRVEVDAVSERRTSSNVIAETAPPERGRWVMAGAHHDSVTAGPGINDNGSGVAALLAIAERLRDRPGLRFGFWTGEELALYGSRHYVRTLGDDGRRDIAGYVNLDMLASPNARIEVYDRDDRIERALRAAIPGREGELSLEGASDHAPFERAGIPVGGIFTGAADRGRRPGPADRCYHRACDTLRHADARLLRRMTAAAEQALRELAR